MDVNILKNKKFSPGFKQFLIKTAAFVAIFILISYFLGRKAYNSNLLYGFDFYIYGGMGYILLFSVLGFILLYRDKLYNLNKEKYQTRDFAFLIISLFLLILFYLIEVNIGKVPLNILNKAMVHILLIGLVSFLIIGFYGVSFINSFMKKFKKELVYFLIFGVIAYALMSKVWTLWPYLSAIVSNVVYFLLSIIDSKTIFNPPDILIFKSFAVKIAEPCSGIYSIFIFTGLYLFITLIDWKKLNKAKVIILFIPAVIGAFIVNIFRVFLLMIVGAYLSKEAALGLYHSYTGMIFFMIYFIIFWVIAYKWMKK